MILTYNDNWVYSGNDIIDADNFPPIDPYNPLDLPPHTIRLKYKDGVTPTFSKGTATQVSQSPNVWDLTYGNWYQLLTDHTDLLEVLGANSTGITNMGSLFQNCHNLTSVALFDTSSVTNMRSMFVYCSSLQSVPAFDTHNVTDMGSMFAGMSPDLTSPIFTTLPLFDTSKVTDMHYMLYGCRYLTTLPAFDTSNVTNMNCMCAACSSITNMPLFDTSKVTNMDSAFSGCYKVESGALALYQQASTQANPPSSHSSTFHDCGRDTTTGAAELAQIPYDWK